MNLQFFIEHKKTTLIGLLALVVVVITIAHWEKQRQANQSVSVKMEYHDQQVVQFFTKVIGSQKKTKIYIPFSFEKQPQVLLLGYMQKSKQMREFLVYHPDTTFLNWSQIRSGDLTLYQRQQTFTSIEDFLTNPPNKRVLIEENVMGQYPKIKAAPLEPKNDISQFDYILTTQVPIKVIGNTFYFETVIDTTDALLDELGQITWVFRAPQANPSNAYYLGNIDITYLQ